MLPAILKFSLQLIPKGKVTIKSVNAQGNEPYISTQNTWSLSKSSYKSTQGYLPYIKQVSKATGTQVISLWIQLTTKSIYIQGILP